MPYTLPPTTRRTTVPSSLTEMCFTACVQTCDCAAFFELRGGEVRMSGPVAGGSLRSGILSPSISFLPTPIHDQRVPVVSRRTGVRAIYLRRAPQTSSSLFTRPQLYL